MRSKGRHEPAFGQIGQAGIAAVIVDKNFAAVPAVADRAMVRRKAPRRAPAVELRARPQLRVKCPGV